ncbi:type II secretion system protein [Puniceicoccus vermicola]|uniref:Type II secretion system protein n=1 Tax=Puniceicoccus vermicola TaxID=388746 RepID=A0A7X1E617_9BACT|nr:type II secretion system protein [Puniceicoccus vermicola]MBC2603648.1 type II secretion system protein [Puniceicoccus vermicola]
MKTPTSNSYRAFTLVELLTVMAILGVLAAILVPVVSKIRVNAERTECASNIRQIGLAIHQFASENEGRLPYVYGGSFGPSEIDGQGTGDRGRIARFLKPYVGDEVFVCADPANIEHARLPYPAFGTVFTMPESSKILKTSYRDPQAERINKYDPVKERLFYCAFSPLDENTGRDDWPHEAKVNALYLDGHIEIYEPTYTGR